MANKISLDVVSHGVKLQDIKLEQAFLAKGEGNEVFISMRWENTVKPDDAPRSSEPVFHIRRAEVLWMKSCTRVMPLELKIEARRK